MYNLGLFLEIKYINIQYYYIHNKIFSQKIILIYMPNIKIIVNNIIKLLT